MSYLLLIFIILGAVGLTLFKVWQQAPIMNWWEE
jgi:hypothetical protein